MKVINEWEKIHKIEKEWNDLHFFVQWINENKLHGKKDFENTEELLCKYFDIDMNKLEKERIEMIKGLSKKHNFMGKWLK